MSNHKCGCQCKGGCSVCKKDSGCGGGGTPLFFEEVVPLSAGGLVTTELTGEYPIGEATRFGVLAASIDVAPVGAATLSVQVYRNGALVPGASVTFTSADAAGSQRRVRFSRTFSPGDTLQLVAVQNGVFATATNVTASLAAR